MTLGGWVFMVGSWLAILGVFTFTMARTLRGRARQDARVQPPADG